MKKAKRTTKASSKKAKLVLSVDRVRALDEKETEEVSGASCTYTFGSCNVTIRPTLN